MAPFKHQPKDKNQGISDKRYQCMAKSRFLITAVNKNLKTHLLYHGLHLIIFNQFWARFV